MKELIITILSAHPEGLLGSVIAAMVSARMNTSAATVMEVLMDMFRDGEIVSKPRIFRPGEPIDNDMLFALPSREAVKIAPNSNQ